MPLTLNVGLSKKVGQPNYGSLGATCNVAVELDANLLATDLEKFHTHVRNAFHACRQAVNDELARQPEGSSNAGSHNGTLNSAPRRDNTRRATGNQIRVLNSMADRYQIDLVDFLQQRFNTSAVGALSITEASNLIDELKNLAEPNGDAA